MAGRILIERTSLKSLQKYHQATFNNFGDHETLVDAISSRPGFFGPCPITYLSLLARRPSIRLSDLEEAVLNDRLLIRASAFRASLFLLSAADYPIYFRATYPLIQASGRDVLARAGVGDARLKFYENSLKEQDFLLPKTYEEITEILFPAKKKQPESAVARLVIKRLCDTGVLVRTTSKGWKGNEFSFTLMANWLPEMLLRPENPEAARTETLRRYLRCYGPASLEDIAWWTGLPLLQIRRSISHLRREAVKFPVEGHREELIGLRETVEILRNPNVDEAGIQFLPPWDPYTFGWANKTRIIEKVWNPWVFDHSLNATSVINDGGKIIGLWQFRDSRVNILEYHVFEPYAARRLEVFKRAESYAMALAELCGATMVNVVERSLPPPLAQREAGAFLWPLGKEMPFRSGETVFQSPMERRTSNKFRGSYLDSDNVVLPTWSSDSTHASE